MLYVTMAPSLTSWTSLILLILLTINSMACPIDNKGTEEIAQAMSILSNRNTHLAYLIDDAAQKYELDPLLLVALIYQESTFRTNIVSSAGAIGWMQVMPFWAFEFGIDPDLLFIPEVNTDIGARILRIYLDRNNGNMYKALRAYNSNNLRGSIYAIKVNQHYKRITSVYSD